MNAYLNYIIEANIGLLLFLACYKLFLHRETNFRMLRIFMLVGILASLLFPFIHFETDQNTSSFSLDQAVPYYWLPEVVIGGEAPHESYAASFSFWQYTTVIYVVGLMLFCLLVFFQLSQLLRVIRNSKTYRLHTLRIAESNEDKPTFSFFRFIFIGKSDQLSTTEKQQIIQHESVHAHQWHSFDILFINVLKILFWFNPFITTYKKIFIHLHEFEADARAVENSDVNKYCSLLAKVALQSADFKLANHFNNSLTVKRIEMMRTIKNKIHPVKVAVMACLIPVSFFIISCQDQIGNGVVGEETSKTKKAIFTIVEEAASFEGGATQLLKHLQENITYPEKAREAGKEGTVYVEFVVNEEGALSDVKVTKGVDPELDAEAIRAIKTLPAWKPGKQNGVPVKQRFIVPVSFNSDFPQSQEESVSTSLYTVSANLYKMDVTFKETQLNGKTTVEGIVISDETKKPLGGTNIIIKGTSKGTTADANGKFRIEVPAGDGQLVLSFVGYDFEEIKF